MLKATTQHGGRPVVACPELAETSNLLLDVTARAMVIHEAFDRLLSDLRRCNAELERHTAALTRQGPREAR